MSICLSPDELERLTGKSQRAQKRYDSQAKALRALRVPHLHRPDKTLIVFRRHVDSGSDPEPGPEPRVMP